MNWEEPYWTEKREEVDMMHKVNGRMEKWGTAKFPVCQGGLFELVAQYVDLVVDRRPWYKRLFCPRQQWQVDQEIRSMREKLGKVVYLTWV